MSYLRAEEILPKEVLEMVQKYVSGRSIYIPCREKKQWGIETDTKSVLYHRNLEIFTRYQGGATVKNLAKEYFLSEKSIQRIIRNQKKEIVI